MAGAIGISRSLANVSTAAARGKATEVGETLQQLQEFQSRAESDVPPPACARPAGPQGLAGPQEGPTWSGARGCGQLPPAPAHLSSACPAPPTSPSTSGTARASSRRPEETRRVRDRSRGPEQEDGAPRRRPQALHAPQLPPGAARTPRATPRPPHFVMGHSDSHSGVAGAGDTGWRAPSRTAHARDSMCVCALGRHGPG